MNRGKGRGHSLIVYESGGGKWRRWEGRGWMGNIFVCLSIFIEQNEPGKQNKSISLGATIYLIGLLLPVSLTTGMCTYYINTGRWKRGVSIKRNEGGRRRGGRGGQQRKFMSITRSGPKINYTIYMGL